MAYSKGHAWITGIYLVEWLRNRALVYHDVCLVILVVDDACRGILRGGYYSKLCYIICFESQLCDVDVGCLTGVNVCWNSAGHKPLAFNDIAVGFNNADLGTLITDHS